MTASGERVTAERRACTTGFSSTRRTSPTSSPRRSSPRRAHVELYRVCPRLATRDFRQAPRPTFRHAHARGRGLDLRAQRHHLHPQRAGRQALLPRATVAPRGRLRQRLLPGGDQGGDAARARRPLSRPYDTRPEPSHRVPRERLHQTESHRRQPRTHKDDRRQHVRPIARHGRPGAARQAVRRHVAATARAPRRLPAERR